MNLFPAVQKTQVGVLARVPFDEGSLTGTITENSEFEGDEFRAFYFRGDRTKAGGGARVRAPGRPGGRTRLAAGVALRFCLSHPAVSTVIPGMRRVRNVESNCRVSDTGPLEEALLQKLRKHAWNKNFYS